MPGFTRDLRQRKSQPYSGPNPIQGRWRHPDDPRVRRERSFATKREAREWIAEQDTNARRGVWVDPHLGRESVEALATAWQESMRHLLAPKTRQTNRSIINRHVLPEFGPRRVAGIDPSDIQHFANRLGDQRAPKTVVNVLSLLKELFDFAVTRKLIAVNPCASVRLPPGRRQRKVTPLPHAELTRLADAMPTARDRAAVLVAGYCGLRAGEVWALRRSSVMLRRLRVNEKITEAQVSAADKSYTILANGLAIGPTKTYNDEPVALPAHVAQALNELIKPGMAADAFIFTDVEGGAMRQSNFYLRIFKPTLQATLAPEYHGFTFHDLRHTCAAYLIEHGFHPKVIQTQMRHTSIQTTMDTYGHLFPDGLDAVADALEVSYRANKDALLANVTSLTP